MRARLAAVAAALVLLSGCDAGGVQPPGESSIDVDTPELRAQKAAAGIEDCAEGPRGPTPGLPDLTLPCLGGGPSVDLSTLTGPLVINLWASNCGPCVREMPVLQKFYERHGDEVAVLGIDAVDTAPKAALDLAAISGVTYPSLADPGGEIYSQDDLRVAPGLPQFILVDADGAVVHQEAGGVDSVAEVEDMVETHLGVSL